MVEEKTNWGEQAYLFIVIIALLAIISFASLLVICYTGQSTTPACNFFYNNWWIPAGCGIISVLSIVFLGLG
jgi:hypothetical protein